MGAVMGSKNLKAIVVRGSKKRLPTADAERLRVLMKAFQPNIQEDGDVEGLARLGTAGIVQGQDADGGLPTRNWTRG
jgi:aldehyde:ferredoxin oxidoreductase